MSTRIKLAEYFGIPKVGHTHVADNQVVSDGFLIKDVERALNYQAIREYVESDETDLEKLWVIMIDKVEGRVVAPIVVPNISPFIPTPITVSPLTVSANETKVGAIVPPVITNPISAPKPKRVTKPKQPKPDEKTS